MFDERASVRYNVLMKTLLQRIGNSQGVVLPKPLLQQLGVDREIDLSFEDGAIVLRAPQPRAGWTEAFSAMPAEAFALTAEHQAFLEMPNDADKDWKW